MYFDEGLSAPFDHALTMTMTILKPTSRGSVTRRSVRPDAKLRIHHIRVAAGHIMPFIEHRTGTHYHPTCTCSIGHVVDCDLRVFGIEGLRVADVSVMSPIVRGNTNAIAIAIAEKAADIVLGKCAVRIVKQMNIESLYNSLSPNVTSRHP